MSQADGSFKSLLSILIVVLVGGFAYFVLFADQTTDQEDVSTGGAVLSYVEGGVEYQNNEGEWIRAEEGVDLRVGNSVEVLGTGRAIIMLDDGSAIRLDSDSRVQLTSLDPNQVIVINEQGEVYARVVPGDRTFEVQASSVIYEAVGTAYLISNTETKQGVEVYESEVKVVTADKEIFVGEGKKYFVKNEIAPDTVDQVKDIAEEDKDEFIIWNEGEDVSASIIVKEPESTGEITLFGSVTNESLAFNWSVVDVDTNQGVKLVKSTDPDPVYPGNDYQFITDGSTSYDWKITDGQTYYFRLCQYQDGQCGVYSNNVELTAPQKTEEAKEEGKKVEEPKTTTKETPKTSNAVNSISLSNSGNGIVSWSIDGYTQIGFKVIWSKNSNPTYPTRSGDKYQYLADPYQTATTLDAFDGAGSYYVRVCEYVGEKCGVYSNQVQIEFQEPSSALTSIYLTGSEAVVSWAPVGYSKQGYKVVWSKTAGPTYPTRSTDKYIYLSDPNATSTTLNAFDGSGTYYVSVCEYLGGKCGLYSNEIVVQL